MRLMTRARITLLTVMVGLGLLSSCQPAPGPDEGPILRPTPVPTPGGPGKDPRDGDDDLAQSKYNIPRHYFTN